MRTLVAPKKLTVRAVHKTFLEIANESGAAVRLLLLLPSSRRTIVLFQSQKRRVDKIRGLLVNARETEPNFIVKALQGKMRINMGPKTVMVRRMGCFIRISTSQAAFGSRLRLR